jgi:hypothetical protein
MPTETIRPNSHLLLKYFVPKGGVIHYRVESSRPVDSYVFDEIGVKEFYGKRDYVESYYGGFPNRRRHDQEIKLPFKGPWYLLIKNNQSETVGVYYEVSS